MRALNAFRHHRNSHRFNISIGSQVVGALNAFRHHRNSHGARIANDVQSRMRSTPFGIIGILTGSPAAFVAI